MRTMPALPADSPEAFRLQSLSQFGLHQLRPSKSDKTVIFVHGILSDSASAWGEPSWPALLVAEAECTEIGVYVFTYRTGLLSKTYSVSDAADAMREHFTEQNIWNQGSIVFVCHSMGGIVVRRFIVSNQARLARENTTLGLFMVASPSLGSRDANLISVLSYAFQHSQAEILRFSQSNTTLDDLNRDFRMLLGNKALRIVGRELLEDRPIRIKRLFGLWRQVVEPFAAAAYFHGEGYEPLKIPGSDHSSIAKPLVKSAIQHQALMRFIKNFLQNADRIYSVGREIPGRIDLEITAGDDSSNSDLPVGAPSGDDEALRAALPPQYEAARVSEFVDEGRRPDPMLMLEFRRGRMLERMLATLFAAKRSDPLESFRSALSVATSQRQVELIAPWLRFVKNKEIVDEAVQYCEQKFRLDWIQKIKIRTEMLGWLGTESLYHPDVNWKESYCQEKFTFTFAQASMHSAWSEQSDSSLRLIASQLVRFASYDAGEAGSGIFLYHWLAMVNGIPARNARVILKQLVDEQVPPEMLAALLSRMCIVPVPEAAVDILKLVNHEDASIRNVAMDALAFIPAYSAKTRDLKSSVLEKGSSSDAIAAGVDQRNEAAEALCALVVEGNLGGLAHSAAWALGRIAQKSPEVRHLLRHAAREGNDKIARSVCVASLAEIGDPAAEEMLNNELQDSRGIETFCLMVGRTYIDGIEPLFRLLTKTPEDNLYVPFLLPCFQRMFSNAVANAAQRAPILDELFRLCDDI